MRAQSMLRPALALVLSCTFVVGCGFLKKKKGADAGAEEDAATVTVTGSGAKNEKDVLRYASEVKVADEPGTIGKDDTKARTFPASGAEVATLAKGTAVTQIAKFFSTGVLVLFVDPAASDGSKLMGWIPPEALAAAPAATTATTVAPVHTVVGVKAVAVDAGAAADAGVAAKDSGAADAAVAAVADAGAAAAPNPDVVAPVNRKCPPGFRLDIKDRQCHRTPK